ncbi:MAG: translation elongation factor EF-1beta [Candidatus Methanomethylophilaceae archaeon]|nr:translation elongation factor EF-1beta [Thermoplasmata archaeon]MBQ3685130.1 translation elongation factor EF-1beta [Candidatus Methanomethylophilaceae archaeon]
MGKIVAQYDIMPESTDVDLDAVIKKLPTILPAGVELMDGETKILPVAFGLMKVNAGFVIDDSDEMAGSKLEEALASIEGIETVSCTSSTNL